MAATPYKLCDAILRRLDAVGVLPHVMLIGSWAVYFYRHYFKPGSYQPSIRTRDMDFLVAWPPPRMAQSVDLPREMADLDFVTGYRGEEGYMILQHPDLLLEFLVPERGRGGNKAVPLPQLGVNAQPLRYLDMLLENAITVRYEYLSLRLPHPARFGLHKLLVAGRRRVAAKADKDRNEARKVLAALDTAGEWSTVPACLQRLPAKWRTAIAKQATLADLDRIVALCKSTGGLSP